MTWNVPARREPRARVRTRQAGVLGVLLAAVLTAAPAEAQSAPRQPRRGFDAPSTARLAPAPIHGLLSLAIGRGLRFNNPYRLATPLGDTAESVSLAATYLDLGAAVTFGRREFRHGAALAGSVALQGIGQLVLTPSYLAEFGLSESFGLRGRAGLPVVIAPDTSLGLEAAVGGTLLAAYGLGVVMELVGDVFFGAATDQTSVTTIPMLSLQVGVLFEHRVRP